MGIVSEPTKFERIHQLPRKTLSSSSVGNVGVVFVRQFVHLTNLFFSATHFDHGFSESFIEDETIVNAQEFSLLAFLSERIRDEVLVISYFLPEAVTGGLSFLETSFE